MPMLRSQRRKIQIVAKNYDAVVLDRFPDDIPHRARAALRRVIGDPIRPKGYLDRPECCLPARSECEASLYPAEKSGGIGSA